jgi:hypothetical protein
VRRVVGLDVKLERVPGPVGDLRQIPATSQCEPTVTCLQARAPTSRASAGPESVIRSLPHRLGSVLGWAVAVASYLGYALLTATVNIPRLGVTLAVQKAQPPSVGGLWAEQPWRVIAFGTFYYATIASPSCSGSARLRPPRRSHPSSSTCDPWVPADRSGGREVRRERFLTGVCRRSPVSVYTRECCDLNPLLRQRGDRESDPAESSRPWNFIMYAISLRLPRN